MGLTSSAAVASQQADIADLYNPFAPISYPLPRDRLAGGARHSQRLRRSEILAAIRRLLTEKGCDNVTVRQVAVISGYAVQTVYNLVGPRNDAISDAISEYSIFVAKTMVPRLDDPRALPSIVDSWVDATRHSPAAALTRQFSLIYFSRNRSIYYRFRERQHAGMRNLLQRQRNCGIIRPDVDINALAEHLVIYSSALWLDWAERQFSLDQLQQKLNYGFATVLSGRFTPQYEHVIDEWLAQTRPKEFSFSLTPAA